MVDSVIKTRSITKKYGSSYAVNNVDITVRAGDIYGLVGKNGAGKTTLFKIISGLTHMSSGNIELFGQSSKKELRSARARTGCIIETPGFFPYLTAEKNLEYYRLQRGIAGRECVNDALALVGLSGTGSKNFKDFSFGMKQRMGLALAIMGNPDLLILDEPINGLDPPGIVETRGILKRLNRERGTTVIISSHILSELSQIATIYGFIDNGMLIKEVCAKEIEEKCRHSLSVKVDDTAKAAVILESKMGCGEYEVLNNNIIRVYQFIDTPELVTQALVSNGVMVYSINRAGTNLETYFIELIGEDGNA